MKTASMPELRNAAESILLKGETLSSFVEQSLRANIAHRRLQMQTEFIAWGLAARAQAKEDNEYYAPDQILRELDELGAKAGK